MHFREKWLNRRKGHFGSIAGKFYFRSMNPWIAATETMVKEKMAHDGTGHDWWHVHRVRHLALTIAKKEDADLSIVELAALLHDVWDHKLYDGDLTVAPRESRKWLQSLSVPEAVVAEVVTIIERISFKGAHVPDEPLSLAGQCVQDADRLDAIGAIGIARTFAYGGSKGRLLYDPNHPPALHDNFEAYAGSTAPTINHFYEKLLLLKDRMHTSTAKRMAEKRHAFMAAYLERFFQDWEGQG